MANNNDINKLKADYYRKQIAANIAQNAWMQAELAEFEADTEVAPTATATASVKAGNTADGLDAHTKKLVRDRVRNARASLEKRGLDVNIKDNEELIASVAYQLGVDVPAFPAGRYDVALKQLVKVAKNKGEKKALVEPEQPADELKEEATTRYFPQMSAQELKQQYISHAIAFDQPILNVDLRHIDDLSNDELDELMMHALLEQSCWEAGMKDAAEVWMAAEILLVHPDRYPDVDEVLKHDIKELYYQHFPALDKSIEVTDLKKLYRQHVDNLIEAEPQQQATPDPEVLRQKIAALRSKFKKLQEEYVPAECQVSDEDIEKMTAEELEERIEAIAA